MSKLGKAFYVLSGLLMAVFVVNLIMGRDGSAMLGNAAEAILLAASAASFGMGTLVSEANQTN